MTDTYEFAATTPRGVPCTFLVREGTNDQSTAHASVTEDEYGLADVYLGAGTAVDVGGYLGTVGIALALDNPDAKVIIVEPVPANVEMIRANIDRNHVSERVTVLHAAAAKPGTKTATVEWDFSGTESGQHHRFVGNAQLPARGTGTKETVGTVTLPQLVKMAGGHIAFLKTDCEGAEYLLLDSPAVADVGLMGGEYHTGQQGIRDLLAATHELTFDGGDVGAFQAVHR